MIYLLGTTVAALRLGRGPSALTAIANTIAFDFFFVPPRFSLYVAETQYLFTLGVMLGVALVIANLMVNVRRQTLMASDREHRTSMLYAASRELTAAPDTAAVSEVVSRHVVAAMGGFAVLLPADSQGGIADTPQCVHIPLSLGDRAFGVLVVCPAKQHSLNVEQRQYIEAIAAQATLALERVRLVDSAAESRAAAERAALRNTLLASISHDLRGPLAAIAGAGGLVARSDEVLDRRRRITLGKLIEEKALDMTGLLSNILDLMRIETSRGAVNSEWHSLEELVGTAIRNNEQRLAQWRLSISIPQDLGFIHVDGQLIVQLLSNLLENVTKHTPAGTRIHMIARGSAAGVNLVVEDDGPGFGGRDPERLFEKFARGQAESHVSGVGLGLAICRAIVHLHGGSIRAEDRPDGGARFEIQLPAGPANDSTQAHLQGQA